MKSQIDQTEYIKQLEAELNDAKAKYNDIYNSIRTVDKAVFAIKKNFNPVYRLVRNLHHAVKKEKPEAKNRQAKHDRTKEPLETIWAPTTKKRLNLILPDFNKKFLEPGSHKDFVIRAIKDAEKSHSHLRIITRNDYADTTQIQTLLLENQIKLSKGYSFYTDFPGRLSSSVRKLETGFNEDFLYWEEK